MTSKTTQIQSSFCCQFAGKFATPAQRTQGAKRPNASGIRPSFKNSFQVEAFPSTRSTDCTEKSWLVNRDPPVHVPPLRNKGLIAGLIKGNQWVLGGRFVRGGRLTCHEKKSDERVRVAPPYSKDNEAKRNASKTQKSDSKSFYWGRVCSCLLTSPCSLDLFWYLYVTTP